MPEKKLSIGTALAGVWLLAACSWWWLAFAPLTQASPEWVELARTVCFGSLDNGLPDTYGWIMLTASPLTMLVALIVLWGTEVRYDLRSLWDKPATRGGLIMLAVLVGGGLTWVGNRIQLAAQITKAATTPGVPGSIPEQYPRSERPAPSFELVNQHGETVTLESLRGQPVILTFAFAHCQTVCPGLVYATREAMNTGVEAKLVIITLDPWRDTPAALPRLAEGWQLPENGHILSGPVDTVNDVIKAYNIPAVRNEDTGEVTHPGLVYVLDAKGDLIYTFNNPSAQWLVEALQRV